MQNTNIEWTDHTINFWWGCTKVSPACQHCYAESVAKVFGKRLFGQVPQWGAGKPRFERLQAARKEALKIQRQSARRDLETRVMKQNRLDVQFPDRYNTLQRRPRVFVNSMSDWLDDEVPIEWLAFLLETLSLCPDVDFQLLTKRPENWQPRLNKVSQCYDLTTEAGKKAWGFGAEWYIARQAPANLWIGTTVENQEQADKRIPALLQIPAQVRFLSCEPLLGAVDLSLKDGDPQSPFARFDALRGVHTFNDGETGEVPYPSSAIHWVIAGGESGGPARPMHPDWVRRLRDQCAAAGVPFFFKQWGEWCPATAEFGVEGSVMPDNGIMPCGKRATWIGSDGRLQVPSSKGLDDGAFAMARMGKDHTGRLLDGVLHDAFPQTIPG